MSKNLSPRMQAVVDKMREIEKPLNVTRWGDEYTIGTDANGDRINYSTVRALINRGLLKYAGTDRLTVSYTLTPEALREQG